MQQLTQQPAFLGEGPCWHAGEQVLYWIDIWGKKLHRFDPATDHDQVWELEEMIGTVAPRRAGGLLLALERGFGFFDPHATQPTVEHLPPLEDDTFKRFNDGKCDPFGRFWCGSMDHKEEQSIGTLYRMDADGTTVEIEHDLGVSNGLGWDLERGVMYHIDSPTKTIFQYDYDPDTGNVTNRRPAIVLGDNEGWPDGMTMDTEGMIWLGHWGGARVTRRDPRNDTILERHDVPGLNATACCFGGEKLNELYITTARKGMTETQLKEFPASGNLFRLPTQVTGVETFAFAG